MRCYVLEVIGDFIGVHQTTGEGDQLYRAKELAQENGRAAVLDGEVKYFWADVSKDGRLEIGAFDEDLCPEED